MASRLSHRPCSAVVVASSSRTPLPRTRTLTTRKPLRPLLLSSHFTPTQKPSSTSTADDTLPSLALLLRGGYVRASTSGIYTLLPNALRIVAKVTRIIDAELGAIGASRLHLPALLPSQPWRQTGRWAAMGSELYKLSDRRGASFVLGPTHEEEITRLVAHAVESDRSLPLRLYQIGTKFRDEPRPRMGLLRTKEFVMKDLYSFDKSAADAASTYDQVRQAYARIFDRIFGKRAWKVAEADSGAIGGNKSHEYHVEDAAGEDTLLVCDACGYSANEEKAVSLPDADRMAVDAAPDDVSVLLVGCGDAKVGEQVLFALVVPRERRLNQVKLDKVLKNLAEGRDDKVEVLYDSRASEVQWDWKDRPEGPLVRFTSISVLADFECSSLDPADLNEALADAVNSFTSHSTFSQPLPLADLFPAQFSSDTSSPYVAPPLTLVDLRTAQSGDTCASCKTPSSLNESKAIEVGHTFYLGERYSRALEAGFLPSSEVNVEGVRRLENGRVPFQMGCYGIGVSRILGALAQRAAAEFDSSNRGAGMKNKKGGFVWPKDVAPFTAVVLVSDSKDGRKLDAAHQVWTRIIRSARSADRSVRSVLDSVVAGAESGGESVVARTEVEQEDEGWTTDQASELVIDDRAATLGSKLADSDLTGYSFRIVVGKHWSNDAKVELQYHASDGRGWKSALLPLDAFGAAS